jgi:ATP-dependent DNA helicase RecQ
MLAYFGEKSEPCGNCDTCLEPPQTWDGTVAAQKLLSAIVRLERERGQRYGAGHLIDILLGKTTPRVTQLGHGTLSVFGVGADLSDGEWRGVVRQLLAQGLVGVSADGYGTLQVTATSDAVLSGARQVPLRRAPVRPPRASTARRTGAAAATADLDSTQADMFERLRGWRAATAKEQGVPAYVVFHDATLRELALRLPATLDELGTVSGIGAAKVDRYGTQVLEALRA